METPQEPETVKALNPFFLIWFHPRKTMRWILDTDPRHSVALLAVLIGISQSTMQMARAAPALGLPLQIAIGGAMTGGALGGLLSLYYMGWLFRITGRWLGGQGRGEEVRAAIAWGELPLFIIFVFWLVLFFNRKAGLFQAFLSPTLYGGVVVIASIWSLLLSCHTVGEAHRFSAWKGLLAIILGCLVPLLIIAGAVIAIPGLYKTGLEKGMRAARPPFVMFQQTARTPKYPVEILTVSDTELTSYRLSREAVRIKLKNAAVVESAILEYDGEFVYVETVSGLQNIARRDIQSIEKRPQG